MLWLYTQMGKYSYTAPLPLQPDAQINSLKKLTVLMCVLNHLHIMFQILWYLKQNKSLWNYQK